MIVIGLTGSFASGKSQATAFFKKLGAKVFDADVCAKKALKKGKPEYKAVVKIFGKDYLKADGELDRKKLAARVFASPKDLKMLNTLVHPGVIFESLSFVKSWLGKAEAVVLDVPLLFESKMEGLCDVTVVVSSPTPHILKRALLRGVERKLAQKILSSQWSAAKKEKMADYVIRNSGSIKDLEKNVKEVFKKISNSKKEK